MSIYFAKCDSQKYLLSAISIRSLKFEKTLFFISPLV